MERSSDSFFSSFSAGGSPGVEGSLSQRSQSLLRLLSLDGDLSLASLGAPSWPDTPSTLGGAGGGFEERGDEHKVVSSMHVRRSSSLLKLAEEARNRLAKQERTSIHRAPECGATDRSLEAEARSLSGRSLPPQYSYHEFVDKLKKIDNHIDQTKRRLAKLRLWFESFEADAPPQSLTIVRDMKKASAGHFSELEKFIQELLLEKSNLQLQGWKEHPQNVGGMAVDAHTSMHPNMHSGSRAGAHIHAHGFHPSNFPSIDISRPPELAQAAHQPTKPGIEIKKRGSKKTLARSTTTVPALALQPPGSLHLPAKAKVATPTVAKSSAKKSKSGGSSTPATVVKKGRGRPAKQKHLRVIGVDGTCFGEIFRRVKSLQVGSSEGLPPTCKDMVVASINKSGTVVTVMRPAKRPHAPTKKIAKPPLPRFSSKERYPSATSSSSSSSMPQVPNIASRSNTPSQNWRPAQRFMTTDARNAPNTGNANANANAYIMHQQPVHQAVKTETCVSLKRGPSRPVEAIVLTPKRLRKGDLNKTFSQQSVSPLSLPSGIFSDSSPKLARVNSLASKD
mmetsp:Transcript_21084/g.39187  ORF Transcript_21084/g.39187 Transcript_21084/m.39187 type:complete len:564 (+) Transcript_21084:71-1762(+)